MRAYHAALRVLTEIDYRVQWATTVENLGRAHEAMKENEICSDPQPELKQAEMSLGAALRVFDPKHTSVRYQAVSEALERTRKLAAFG